MTISAPSIAPIAHQTPARRARRLIFPFAGSDIGGAHVSAFTLAQNMQHDWDVDCIVLANEGTAIAHEAKRRGLRVVAIEEPIASRERPLTDWRRRKPRARFLSRISSGQGALVHCNNLSTLSAWGPAARALGLPVIYHHRALAKMWLPHRIAALASANAVITISEATAANVRGLRADAVKIFNPFELDVGCLHEAPKAELCQESGWPLDTKIVGWVGNFWARKRPALFLEAAAEIWRIMPECRFVLFGRDGDMSQTDLAAHASRLGLGNVVAFAGFRLGIERNIAALDLLLAPAVREPFGRTLVEAIVLGVPIVAARSAGHSEILQTWGGGVGFDPSMAPRAIGDLCRAVLAAPDKVRLDQNKRAAVARTLAPEAHAGAVMAIYEACCNG